MDYGKYKYEAAQRLKESKKKASNVVVKEMKYRPKISGGDFDTKTRKVEKFLQEGHKVKITIMFRGREVTHPELGRRILDNIAERVDEYAKVEAYPRLDGRNMTMILGPDSKKKPKKRPNRERPPAAEPTDGAAPQAGGEAPPASGNGSDAGPPPDAGPPSAEPPSAEPPGAEPGGDTPQN
jgi:translation initiation factor IF-3